MVRQAIQASGGHFGGAADLHPFAAAEVGGEDPGGLVVEVADPLEAPRPTGRGTRQVAPCGADDGIAGDACFGQSSSVAEGFSRFQSSRLGIANS